MKKKLKDIARVMRCQIRREDAGPLRNPIYWRRTYLPLWHELGLEDIDRHTGFILRPRLKGVKPVKEPGLFAVAPLDILLCFLGSPSRIGEMGLMIKDYAAVPATNMCIIRAFGCDPVWLYYRLQADDVSAELAVSGDKGKAFLSLSKIRELELELPDARDIEAINFAHRKVLDSYQKSLQLIYRQQGNIREILRGEKKTLFGREQGKGPGAEKI